MPSLLQVLHDATGHGATEVVLEPGRAPTMRTSFGIETMSGVLSEGDLFDALSGVLGPDQQAELAVGNVVEFQLHDGMVRWHLGVQAGTEGVIIRGRNGAAPDVAERGVPLDLPPLARNDREGEAVSIPAAPARRRDTAWDLPSIAATPPPTPSGQLPSWLLSAGAPSEPTSAAPAKVPDPPDFAMRRVPPTGEPPATLGDPGDSHLQLPQAGTADPFAGLASQLVDSALCLVRGHGNGERLARHLGAYALILEPGEALGRRFDPLLSAFVIRLEDPSTLLGWMLRRVEEGTKVIVEVGARTSAGGRRVLLGVEHGATAASWFDAVTTFWVAEDRGQWSLTRE